MRRSFVVSLAIAFVAFALLFGGEFFVEWWRLGRPGYDAISWDSANNAKLVDVLSPMARAYNNVLAMLLATIGLAIPLTANMHTPTLIEIFLRDRINRLVLSFMALGAGHVLFVDYLIGPKFAPMWAFRIAVWMAIVGWIILIPYFFYVVRFLEPGRIIDRLREETNDVIEEARRGRCDAALAQERVSERVDQLGTIILKSLDRADRMVARDGAWAIKELLDRYEVDKPHMPAGWFKVDRADFTGFSSEALEMLGTSRTWYEMKCLMQLQLAYQTALSKASDSVSTLSDTNRIIADRANARGDDEALRLSIRFFNNFLREAIKAKNVHAVYDVFWQYRLLAKDLVGKPDRLREIGQHFTYYSVMARNAGLTFAPQLVVFDLGFIVRRAYEADSDAAFDLLTTVLALPHRTGADIHSLAVKAKLILGGFFLETGRHEEAERVRDCLADVDAREIADAERELLAADRVFFEVTDRQLNLEYVPPERREPLSRFCASLAAARE